MYWTSTASEVKGQLTRMQRDRDMEREKPDCQRYESGYLGTDGRLCNRPNSEQKNERESTKMKQKSNQRLAMPEGIV